MLPKVSIITATYNLIQNGRLSTFNEMVASVNSQTYENIEHVFIDGGSEDGTVQLLENICKDSSKAKFFSEKDKGIYDAMNKGIVAASGQYISFMHSDDFFNGPQGIELAVQKMKDGNFDFFYADTRMLRNNKKDKISKAYIESFCYRLPFCHQALIVKKDTFSSCGLFDLNYEIAADYKYILKLILKGYKGVYASIPFVTFRHGGHSTDDEKLFEEYTKAIHEVYGENNGLSLKECRNIISNDCGPAFFQALLKIKDDNVRNSLKKKINFKTLRRGFFSVRIVKGKSHLKIFGKKII